MATHLVGGEIYYECTGGDNYDVTLIIYRDCGPTNTNNTQFDQNAIIGVYTASGTLVSTQTLPFPGATVLPVVVTNPCLAAPPSICIEEARYTGTFNLPPIAGGYYLVYQRCCRNPSIQNIITPGDWGATYVARVPEQSEAICNNSAYFTNYPPLALCADEDFVFDHSATDPDADSLVYSFCTPYHGGNNTNNIVPNPPSPPIVGPTNMPPYYQQVPWLNPYSETNPLPANPVLAIDPQTGVITGTPNQQGIYAFAVCVREYRNGVFLNESRRDFQFTVVNCVTNTEAIIPGQTESGSAAAFCSGTTIHPTNSSINATTYFWDFGDPATTADTSSLFEPSYTYTDTGTYTIMLIANPGMTCADTTYTTYELYPAVQCQFPAVPGQCVAGNLFQLQADGTFGPDATVSWDFGPLASPQFSNLWNPEVSFSDTGRFAVTLTVTDHDCTDTYTDTIVVYPPPTVSFSIPSYVGCAPYGVQFSDSSFAWTDITYLWDFGDGNYSDLQNPYHVYEHPGTYDVILAVSTDSGCIGSAVSNPAPILVNPSPFSDFDIDPLQTSIFEPEVNVVNYATGDTAFMFFMDDGSTYQLDQFAHSYMDTGHYYVTQITWNEYGCTDTAVIMVHIMPELLFYAPNSFTPNGDGLNEVWKPWVGGTDEYELMIYNRWGEIIWQTNDPTEGWDGIPRGGNKLAPIDTYVFLAVFRDINTKIIHEKMGHITIVR